LAADLEEQLHESSELIKSSGGVFEVEDRGNLIFSKKQSNRFPHETEIVDIIRAVEGGETLAGAQAKAAEKAPQPISFFNWLSGFLKR
jgi:selT/selW/selH-like putative selenoprotein